jgi:putative pyruvate formate lyase activating enzyme
VGLPSHVTLARSGELARRCHAAAEALRSCSLCPRACGIDRAAGERGWCGAGPLPRIYRHMVHHGEEPPISGASGSGVVFFSRCTLACVYCQNHAWSQDGRGTDRSPADLASMMLELQRAGCHNVNLVSGTQYIPAILDSLLQANLSGFALPVVWNTSAYESAAGLSLLDGAVDIYLADLRYGSSDGARIGSDAPDYVEASTAALRAMRDQVGLLHSDADGVARRGLIVRHLVLPNRLAGTREAMRFIAAELGPDTFVSLMSQYYPAHRAAGVPELARAITPEEWIEAQAALAEAGLSNGWVQEFPSGLSPIAGTEIGPDARGLEP